MNKLKVMSIGFIVMLSVIVVMTIRLSTESNKMYDYDYLEVAKQIEIESLPFDYKFPTKVPFEQMTLYESQTDGKQQMVVTLANVHKSFLDIQISKNCIEYTDDVKRKNVSINNEFQGTFIPTHSGKRILLWEDNGVYYQITYFQKFTQYEVSKNQLVKMAESFE